MVTDANTKQLENSKETHKVVVGNTDCDMGIEWRSNRSRRKMSQVQTTWIGGAELIPWPPRSPDLTRCNFYPIYLSIYLSMALQSLWTLAPLFQFLNLYTVGRTPWTGDQPIARPLPTHKSCSLCSVLRPPVTSSPFGPNILLSTLFSNIHSLCSSHNARDQVSHPQLSVVILSRKI
jgi:hypothetical protein